MSFDLWQRSRHLWQQSRRVVTQFRQQGRMWVALFVKTLQATLARESAIIASSISYFTLFSLFPLTLLTVVVASLWLDPVEVEKSIITQLEFAAPALGELLGANIEAIIDNRNALTGFALLTLVWSSSNVFLVLLQAMDRIWNVNVTRSIWRHRGLAILMVVMLGGLLLGASFVQQTTVTIVNALFPPEWGPLYSYTSQFWTGLLSISLFAILYYFLPHIPVPWYGALPGAVAAGVLWEVAKRAFLFFVANYLSRSNLIYGSMATITVFLTWSYVSGIIFLFGGHFNVAYVRYKERQASVL